MAFGRKPVEVSATDKPEKRFVLMAETLATEKSLSTPSKVPELLHESSLLLAGGEGVVGGGVHREKLTMV